MPRPNQNRASEDAADGPAYVVDFQDQYGHFIHKLETPRRAELLARLLMTTFSGNDRGDQAPDAFNWFVGADKLAETQAKFKAVYGIDIPVMEFAGVIPSLQKMTEAVYADVAGAPPAPGADGAAAAPRPRNANALQGSALQDALFAKMKNFFAEILPPDTLEERKGKKPAAAAAAPAPDGTVLTEDQM